MTGSAQVSYREYRTGTGKEKRAALIKAQPFGKKFSPERRHRYLLRPLVGEDAYWTRPDLVDMFPVRFSGVNTNRDEAVIATDTNSLSTRMKDYFDKSSSNQLMSQRYSALMRSVSYFDASRTRTQLLETSAFDPSRIVELNYRPFDSRKLYFEPALINRERPEFFEQVFAENAFLVSSQTMRRGYDRHSFSKTLIDLHIFDPDARAFPLQLRYKPEGLFDNDGSDDYHYLPNAADFYDDLVQNKLLKLAKVKDGCTPMPKPEPVLARYGEIKDDAGKPTADAFRLSEALFYHALAVMHAPSYREEHAEYLAEDWPRIPLPETRAHLEQGEALGKDVATLLDPLSDASRLLTPYSELGRFPEDLLGELKIGSKPAWAAGVLTLSAGLRLEDVPKPVWDYTLGGYPVVSKWLGYRKDTVLNTQDARWLSEIVKRIAALIGMGEALNEYYKQNSAHK